MRRKGWVSVRKQIGLQCTSEVTVIFILDPRPERLAQRVHEDPNSANERGEYMSNVKLDLKTHSQPLPLLGTCAGNTLSHRTREDGVAIYICSSGRVSFPG
jgi:hypothetical protein